MASRELNYSSNLPAVKEPDMGQGLSTIMPFLGQMAMMNTMRQRQGGQQAQIPNAQATGGTNEFTGTTTKTPTGMVEGELSKQEGEKMQSNSGFSKVVNLLGNTVSQIKGSWEEQNANPITKNIPGMGMWGNTGGPLKGGVAHLMGKMNAKGFGTTSALPEQLTQSGLAMMGLTTNQNRIIGGIIDKLTSGLPGEGEVPESLESKVRQTTYDMYGFNKSQQKLGITPENLDKYSKMSAEQMNPDEASRLSKLKDFEPITPDEKKALEPIIQKILNQPSAKQSNTGILGYGDSQGSNNQSQGISGIMPQSNSQGSAKQNIMMLAPDGSQVPVHPGNISSAIKRGLKMPQGQ